MMGEGRRSLEERVRRLEADVEVTKDGIAWVSPVAWPTLSFLKVVGVGGLELLQKHHVEIERGREVDVPLLKVVEPILEIVDGEVDDVVD